MGEFFERQRLSTGLHPVGIVRRQSAGGPRCVLHPHEWHLSRKGVADAEQKLATIFISQALANEEEPLAEQTGVELDVERMILGGNARAIGALAEDKRFRHVRIAVEFDEEWLAWVKSLSMTNRRYGRP